MKYFAKLDLNNTVINVIQCDDDATEESMNILLGHTHKETWKDGSQRQSYAQMEGTYDPAKDVYPIQWDEDNQRWYGSARTAGTSLIWDSAATTWVVG